MYEHSSDVMILVPTLGQRKLYLRECLISLVNQSVNLDVYVAYPSSAIDFMKDIEQDFPSVRFLVIEGSQSKVINEVLINFSNHEYVNWIGDDDILLPNAISDCLDTLAINPTCVGVFGNCVYIDEWGQTIAKYRVPRFANGLSAFIPGILKLEGGLFRRDLFSEVGGINLDLKYSPDTDVILKLKTFGKFVKTASYLSKFRIHSTSITSQNRSKGLIEGYKLQFIFARSITDKFMVLIFSIPIFVLKHTFFVILKYKSKLIKLRA